MTIINIRPAGASATGGSDVTGPSQGPGNAIQNVEAGLGAFYYHVEGVSEANPAVGHMRC